MPALSDFCTLPSIERLDTQYDFFFDHSLMSDYDPAARSRLSHQTALHHCISAIATF